ncbi:MAG TPA: AI-2E family transporter, partial [Candidatus Oscillibacter excrementigallinarum]|nr:AI-2E family transporter [Candidatus Oscillibacter excrementigallinarum]
GLLLALAGIRITATITSLVQQIPSFYYSHILPALTELFTWLEELLAKLDPSLMSALQELQTQLIDMLWQLVSSFSGLLLGGVSLATSLATSLPVFLIRMLLMVISTFFITIDYEKIVRFCLGCLRGNTRRVVLQIKAYVVGTLFVCIRSYALIMCITFVELSIGLSIIGIERAMLVALLIAIFDILPVLGTGGIMIPWVILSALGGDLPQALALLVLYVIITVIRNIIEPRIVGAQIGLHPVLTLMSMFVGNHLFGIVGLFGLPILLSLLRYLNDNGTISLFPVSALGRSETAGDKPNGK